MAIILPSGFNITNVDPIDSRISVADASARLGFSTANVYEGLTVYQRDTNEVYVLIDATTPSSTASWSLIYPATSVDIVMLGMPDLTWLLMWFSGGSKSVVTRSLTYETSPTLTTK